MSDPFPIGPTGIWECDNLEHYPTDEGLVKALIEFLRENNPQCSVMDLGCGSGNFVNALNDASFYAYGLDGNSHTVKWAKYCGQADLTKPVTLYEPFDWVLCLETGEHIPNEFNHVLLDNISELSKKGAIISWFPEEGHGIGHVNPRSNEWVKEQMQSRGFTLDDEASLKLRRASTLWWYEKSLQVFRRSKQS